MNRKVKKQMNLFLKHRFISYNLKRINKEKDFLNKHTETRWDKKRIIINDAYLKWNKQRKKLYYEWHKITNEKMKDFPYIHKTEIMNYYSDPKRINDYNPFKDYYN